MSAALPPTDKHASAVGNMSKGRVVKGIEQTGCGASKSAQGDGKFAATVATPLQYASAGDSPPTTLLFFTLDVAGTGGGKCYLRMLLSGLFSSSIAYTQLSIAILLWLIWLMEVQ